MCAALTFHQIVSEHESRRRSFGHCSDVVAISLVLLLERRRRRRLAPVGGGSAVCPPRAAGGGFAPGWTAPNAMRAAAGSAIAPASAACRARRCGGLCLRSSGPAARWPAQRTATFGAGALATCSQFWGTGRCPPAPGDRAPCRSRRLVTEAR